MSKHRILVPEAREEVNQLKAKVAHTTDPNEAKYEIAKEHGIHLRRGYNGDLKAKDAGKVGGNIGGSMVREFVEIAKQNLTNEE
ncbi:alpha/beta-type small acid-soluble spore protein [Salirhabdus salicampi]|uniref:alpha/beta-type small acid-soluble spore protein n=1 Tax=Salirhabdus salicampi TaxID=476102 RepID=UPI00266C8E23|nr:alpha/beta-type small acid-soluble spore protein [Salirhabdus salicampi]